MTRRVQGRLGGPERAALRTRARRWMVAPVAAQVSVALDVARAFQARVNRAAFHACVMLSISVPAVAQQPITFNKDVAPLLVDRCGMCHHPGGSAPFSLLSYPDVK